MPNISIYNTQGKSVGEIELNAEHFGIKANPALIHEAVVAQQANCRRAIAHTKTKGEVSGGGKKPWKQKGTGRARHGSTRSPIWVGGGVAHGPRNEQNYSRKINKKARTKALYTILSRKFKEGEILFVDNVEMAAPKAKEARNIIQSLSKIKGFEKLSFKKTNAAMIALPKKSVNVE